MWMRLLYFPSLDANFSGLLGSVRQRWSRYGESPVNRQTGHSATSTKLLSHRVAASCLRIIPATLAPQRGHRTDSHSQPNAITAIPTPPNEKTSSPGIWGNDTLSLARQIINARRIPLVRRAPAKKATFHRCPVRSRKDTLLPPTMVTTTITSIR